MWLRGIERHAGLPGVDIRLVLQVSNEVQRKMRSLGLDPRDTNGAELYGALKTRLLADELRVKEALRVEGATPQATLSAVVKHLNTIEQASQVVVLKPAVAKRILKKLKPKMTMKLLGYRSLDSMLKHESVAELLAASQIAESKEWHVKRLSEYRKLTPSNFELRPVHFTMPTSKKWPNIAEEYTEKYRHNIMSVPELGTVVVLPLHIELQALAITVFGLCVQALNDIRSANAYLKMHQVRPDFGEVIAGMSDGKWSQVATIQGRKITWQVLHWFYGSAHNRDTHPELFEPHVQPEDMWLAEAESILLKLDPEMKFWQGTHFLGMLDGTRAVSLNILDIALSVCNARHYSRRLIQHMQKALYREVAGRYLAYPKVHHEVSVSLEDKLTPEFSSD